MATIPGGIQKVEVWDKTLGTAAWQDLETDIKEENLQLPDADSELVALADGQGASAAKSSEVVIEMLDPNSTGLTACETMESDLTRTFFRFTRNDGSTFMVPDKGAANVVGAIPHIEQNLGATAGEFGSQRLRFTIFEASNTEFSDA